MKRQIQMRVAGTALLGLLLLAMVFLVPEARADEPMLAIRLIGGESAIYAVSEIEQIGFEGEEMLVVVTGSGSNNYAPESIAKIEFLWEFSSVKDPKDAAARHPAGSTSTACEHPGSRRAGE
ncbi:MAG: hypothetical protein KAY24_12435 [Candidatus Eisenbacteria sp.]|nr:hypothetical protein [Candidatus Eisenbacteria bacterium]